MELATWIIAIFTIILAFATGTYAWISWLAYNASNEQAKALKALTAEIRDLPRIFAMLDDDKEKRKQITETREKEQRLRQQGALGKR